METLFDPVCRDRVLARIERLQPDSPREWGKMDVAQALAHCALALETATGDAKLSRPWIARVIGPMFKGSMLGAKPFMKNGRTHPQLVMQSPMKFEPEQARLISAIQKFHDAGPAAAANFEHALLGRLTGEEWSFLHLKHLDHHLRQFKV